MQKLKVQKWGNSLAIRIPKSVADDLGLSEGSQMNYTKRSRKLILEAEEESLTLDALVANISRANLHPATNWGTPQGQEIW